MAEHRVCLIGWGCYCAPVADPPLHHHPKILSNFAKKQSQLYVHKMYVKERVRFTWKAANINDVHPSLSCIFKSAPASIT